MRRKKHKHARRAVRFYKINSGFKEPFKVLLDGNFLHVLLQCNLGDPKEVLAKLLGAPVKTYVTPCIVKELNSLGPEFAETRKAARKPAIAMMLSCGHDSHPLSASECILACVGQRNAEHYFVGTQDRQVRRHLENIRGGARLFCSVNGVHVDDPSPAQKLMAQQVNSQNMAAAQREVRPLEDVAHKEGEQPVPAHPVRKKKAKGPNPLSVKKKVKGSNPLSVKKKVSGSIPLPVKREVEGSIPPPVVRREAAGMESGGGGGAEREDRERRRRRRKRKAEADAG